MKKEQKQLIEQARRFVTDVDIYSGHEIEKPPLAPNNIVVFTREHLRIQDYAETGHHRHVLVLFLDAAGTLFLGKESYSARPGEAMFIRPFQPHYYAIPTGPICWLFITFELPQTQRIDFREMPVPLSAAAQDTLSRLLHAYQQGWPEECSLRLALLLLELRGSRTIAPAFEPSPDEQLAGKVNACIHDRLAEGITIEKLARECGISASHLRLKFRNTMGVSLGRHIKRIQLDRARHLLQTRPKMSVGEIAYTCGYSSPAVFCRAFKTETGHTPATFRHRGSQDRNDHQIIVFDSQSKPNGRAPARSSTNSRS